ncbi:MULTISPECIES: DUF1194 domain-containing protein [unclassified Ruegeria]|uniref:DUF1194 domain-containing protein n=1 Tax=unclassified Ruegeria TaxID=2625375 RepID=UPI001488769E|nr:MULTISPECIES: DUF1194 domain-containing protein [unclassified Ruegeria]
MIRPIAIAASFLGSPAACDCRQALALGLDVSGSVDQAEYRLQLDGVAAALQSPEVQQLILSEGLAPVRMAIFEWSETHHQRILVNWTDIRVRQDLARIEAKLSSVTRSNAPQGTALGSAMRFGADLLAQQSECWKQTLDLSGDGKRNLGPHPQEVKNELSRSGITINGLVIGVDDADQSDQRTVQVSELTAYFTTSVIMGPDAFVEVALGFDEYKAAMTRKLIRELEGLSLSAVGRTARP